LYQGTASAVPTLILFELEGFSPCYGNSRQKCRSEPGAPFPPNFLCYDEDERRTRLLQSDHNANLLIEVLRNCVAGKEFEIHDFVVMPDHVHLLLTVNEGMTIEKAMQLVKGRFSYRLKKEFSFAGEVWQRAYSESRADSEDSFVKHREYIALNPVKAGLAAKPGEYPYCFTYLADRKQRRG
jgi:putative transposase